MRYIIDRMIIKDEDLSLPSLNLLPKVHQIPEKVLTATLICRRVLTSLNQFDGDYIDIICLFEYELGVLRKEERLW